MCDILGDSTLVFLGKCASDLAREPCRPFGQWPLFLLQPRTPVKCSGELIVSLELKQVPWGSFRVVV